MTFVAVISAFGLFFFTMAVGVLMGRKPIAGSCGGLANVGLNGECKVCGKTPGSCDTETKENNTVQFDSAAPSLAIDAMASRASSQVSVKTSPVNKTETNPVKKSTGNPLDPLDF